MHQTNNILVEITYQDPAQVVICGSTLFACQLAIESADAGLNTVLAMERLNPFHEAINCLNPWVKRERSDAFPSLLDRTLASPDLIQKCDDRLYFNPTEAAIEIEDRLCGAGVRLYYNSPVVGALTHETELGGVVFGGKPGLYAIEGALIVDATLHATVARVLDLPAKQIQDAYNQERIHYSIERCKSTPCNESDNEYVAANGFEVTAENRSRYTHFTMTYPARPQHPLSHADEFREIYAAALDYTPKLPSQRFRGADGYLRQGSDRVETINGSVRSHPNLRIFSPSGVPENPDGQLALLDHEFLFDTYPRELRSDVLGSAPDTHPTRNRPCYRFRNDAITSAQNDSGTLRHQFTDPGCIFPGMTSGEVQFTPPAPSQPSDLTIVGTGTTGVAAAAQASDLQIETRCIDAAAEPGGTVTVGGVTNLWYGRDTKGFSAYYSSCGAENDGLNALPFYQRMSRTDSTSLLMLTPVCGVAVEDRELRAVYVVTPWGLAAIGTGHTIDATGDGSLAAWAGCDYHFGSERDELTLWGSLGSFVPGHQEARRQFLTPLDERDPEDTRRLIQGMRRFERRGASPSFFIAPRESRHIHAKKTVTYLDAIAGRRFSDGILRFRSNWDMKGSSSSDLSHTGLITQERLRNFEVTLPYGSMTPNNMNNLLVAGKAYDSTSDALALARMQKDLAMMGRASAYAMHQCVTDQVPTHAISIERLQESLMAEGILEATDIADDDVGIGESPEDLLRRIEDSPDLEQTLEPTAKLILLQRMSDASPQPAGSTNPSVTRYLAAQEDPNGIAAGRQLLMDWQSRLGSTLPKEDRMPDRIAHLLPDHAFTPLPLHWLMALAQANDESFILPCEKIVTLVSDDTSLNFNTRWCYVFAVAYSCERVAGPGCVNLLERLLLASFLDNVFLARGADLRKCLDTEAERFSYLRLCLLRALARSGSPQGHEGLIKYLQSAHACYARSARSELQELTGQDFLFDQSRWQEWLESHPTSIEAKPYRSQLD